MELGPFYYSFPERESPQDASISLSVFLGVFVMQGVLKKKKKKNQWKQKISVVEMSQKTASYYT